MEWTAEMIREKAGLITARARHFWRLWSFVLDPSMEEDLRQEGWCAALQWPPELPTLRLKIDDALKNLISYWLRGVPVWASARVLRYQEPLTVLAATPSPAPSLPHSAEQRELIRRIWRRATPRMRTVWALQVLEDGAYLDAAQYTALGLTRWSVSRDRAALKALGQRVRRG